MRLDHVQVAAPPGCEEAARAFYGALLGLPEVDKPEPMRPSGGAWFALGAQQLHVGVAGDFAPATKAHPGLSVTDAELDALAARLEAAGARWSGTSGCPGSAASTPRTLSATGSSYLRAPAQPRTPSGPSGERLVLGRRPDVRLGPHVVGHHVRDRRTGEPPDAGRQVAGDPARALAGQRRDDHLVVPARVPRLGEGIERVGVAADALGLDAGLPPSGERRVESPAHGLFPGEPGTLARHEQRHVDRAFLGALLDRVDQVT